jgi:cell division septum initiation protein DivIVA
MSEDIEPQPKDIRGRTWLDAFYVQTKAFLEKNSEHVKEIERLKAEVERLTKAGDAMVDMVDWEVPYERRKKLEAAWNAAKEGKGQP